MEVYDVFSVVFRTKIKIKKNRLQNKRGRRKESNELKLVGISILFVYHTIPNI